MPWLIGGGVAATALIFGLVAWMLSSSNGAASIDVSHATASGPSGDPIQASSSSTQSTARSPTQYYESILSSDSSQHQSALRDFVQLGGKFGEQLQKASTGGVDPTLTQSLQATGQDFHRLTDRMVSFSLLDESGRKSILAMLKSDPAVKVESVKKQIDQFRSSPAAKNKSVIRAYNQVSAYFGSVQSAIVGLVTPMPTPKGFTAETELMMLESHRRLLSAAFAVQSEADLQRLGTSFNKEAGRLTKQRDLRAFFIRQKPVFEKDSTYQARYAGMQAALNRRMEDLESKFDLAPLNNSMATFEAANASIITVKEDYAKSEEKKKQKQTQERDAASKEKFEKLPESVKKSRREWEDRMAAEDRKRFEESIERERKRHSASEFVVIRLDRKLPFFKQFDWEMRLQETLECEAVRSHELSDDEAVMTLAYNGSIDDVADAIWFGKVISSDADKRTLEVQMNGDVED